MPTPDTEALAARIRAVERALTDETTTLDPPSECDTESRGPSDTDDPPAATVRADGAGEDLEQRLYRLEAAVQSLRAALGDPDADTARDTARPRDPADPPEPVTASDATRRGPPRPSRSTERRDTDWPDDLADAA